MLIAGREAVDLVDVGLLHLAEELAGVGAQRLDVAALPLGVDRIEGEAALAASGEAGDHDQAVARHLHVEVLEVVLARAAHDDPIGGHRADDIRPMRTPVRFGSATWRIDVARWVCGGGEGGGGWGVGSAPATEVQGDSRVSGLRVRSALGRVVDVDDPEALRVASAPTRSCRAATRRSSRPPATPSPIGLRRDARRWSLQVARRARGRGPRPRRPGEVVREGRAVLGDDISAARSRAWRRTRAVEKAVGDDSQPMVVSSAHRAPAPSCAARARLDRGSSAIDLARVVVEAHEVERARRIARSAVRHEPVRKMTALALVAHHVLRVAAG